MKKFIARTKFFSLTIALILLFQLFSGALAITPPEIGAKYAILVDPVSEEVLFERASHERAYPASVTKVMTALLVLEHGSLSDVITVSATALENLHPDGSSAGLKAGEEMSLSDLLYCILIASANDACNVVAEHISESVDAFVLKMNEKAKELGCTGTQFTNSHGLHDEDHYTTAYDSYLILREALRHPEFLEICNTASIAIPKTNLSGERYFNTTDHLISTKVTPDYIYPYAKGGKTGHTTPAGYCLVSAAEKGRLLLIAVVLGCERDPETSLMGSFVDSKTLYEWGFNNFSEQTMLDKSEIITEVIVRLAKDKDHLILMPRASVATLLPNDFDLGDVTRTVTIFDEEGITAPIEKGQILGEISLMYDGRDYGVIPLAAMNSVSRDQFLYYMDLATAFLSKTSVKVVIGAVFALIVLYAVFLAVLRRGTRQQAAYRGRKRRRK